ncbi:MAG TPA: S24 family peptidase [Gemmatimonadaceae bacterium]
MPSERDKQLDVLSHLLGTALEHTDEGFTECEPFLRWLAREARSELTSAEKEESEREAIAFARRVAPRIKAANLDRRLPRQPLEEVPAASPSGLREAINVAAQTRHAPLLDMSVAAGTGRALWEEPCDTWVKVPLPLPDGRHLALRVNGDSMNPLLESGDVILVGLDRPVSEGDMVVAQRSENEYVVKRVANLSDLVIELESLNPDHPRFNLRRQSGAILGVVVARFRR